MAYDYQAKGAADFAAGLRDDKLYLATAPHCSQYRAGWQQARREKEKADEASQTAAIPAAPLPETPPTPKQEAPRAQDSAVAPAQPQTESKPKTKKKTAPTAQLDLFG